MNVPTSRRPALVLAICCASIVVVVMDISIVTVALPSIRRDLGASVSGLQWTVDAYTLVLAGFLVLAGSAADRFGRKRVFQCGLAAFGVGPLTSAGIGLPAIFAACAAVAAVMGGLSLLVAHRQPSPAAVHPWPTRPRPLPCPAVRTGEAPT